MTSSTVHPTTVISALRMSSLVTAVATVLQFLLGGYQFTAHNPTIASFHAGVGLFALVASIVAAVAAGLNARAGGNRGLMFHTLATAVLILVQYGLGEMASSQALVIVHMVLGFLIMLSAIAMARLAIRKPHARA